MFYCTSSFFQFCILYSVLVATLLEGEIQFTPDTVKGLAPTEQRMK